MTEDDTVATQQEWEVTVAARGGGDDVVEVTAASESEAKKKAEQRPDVRRAKAGEDAVVPFDRTEHGSKVYIAGGDDA